MAGSGGVSYDVGSWRLGDDGCIHRRGKLRYSNGDVYDGEWVNGKRHGTGTLRFGAGSKSSYIGDFRDNFFHGFGLLTIARSQHPLTKQWRPGESFEGEFQNGKRHGRGRATTTSGDTYDGEYQHDVYHGRGVCTYKNGDAYDGQWSRGKWHGHGELRLKDGSKYVGDFVGGLFHGFGKFQFGSGGRHGMYAGDYRFGQRHGKGERVFGDGKKYQGDWRDDEMQGVGVLEWDAQFKFVGEFVCGLFHGHGVVSYANGDAYEGSFAKGHLDGRGKFVYRDGGVYEGEFRLSKKHGRGTRVFSTGDITYDGEWQDDVMHGHGVLERRIKIAGKTKEEATATALYRYDGAFQNGEQTGEARITYKYTPPEDDDGLFEWTQAQAYEFPRGSGLWHCGRGVSTYVGVVQRGAFHGHGELQSPDGKFWKGEWRNGTLHGEAQCVYLPLVHEKLLENEKDQHHQRQQQPTGLYRLVRYDGQFVDNVRDGRGRALLENGDWIDGVFAKGFVTGIVKVRFCTGRERYAEYVKGQWMRWLSAEEEEEEEEKEEEERERGEDDVVAQRQSLLLRALIA